LPALQIKIDEPGEKDGGENQRDDESHGSRPKRETKLGDKADVGRSARIANRKAN
jgi:hypothetical protein